MTRNGCVGCRENRPIERSGSWLSRLGIDPCVNKLATHLYFSKSRVPWSLPPQKMPAMHYGSPSSSLPSDYAILSHYASAMENTDREEHPHAHDFHDTNEPSDTQDDISHGRRVIRRGSLSSPRTQLPERFDSKTAVPDEYTPLLVPPIEEEVGAGADLILPQNTAKVYRDEFRVLFNYTLPVLRYASPFICCP